MAKSLRSKSKRTFRRSKRESQGTAYNVTDAARLQRLSAKLRAKFASDGGEDAEIEKKDDGAHADADQRDIMDGDVGTASSDPMTVDPPKKVSTSGPRMSRRASWRMSKGMDALPNRPSTLNKQGLVKARRKSGRSHRRR